MEPSAIRVARINDGWIVQSGIGYYAVPLTKQEAIANALKMAKSSGADIEIMNEVGEFVKLPP